MYGRICTQTNRQTCSHYNTYLHGGSEWMNYQIDMAIGYLPSIFQAFGVWVNGQTLLKEKRADIHTDRQTYSYYSIEKILIY